VTVPTNNHNPTQALNLVGTLNDGAAPPRRHPQRGATAGHRERLAKQLSHLGCGFTEDTFLFSTGPAASPARVCGRRGPVRDKRRITGIGLKTHTANQPRDRDSVDESRPRRAEIAKIVEEFARWASAVPPPL
jgi:hypothetical protein